MTEQAQALSEADAASAIANLLGPDEGEPDEVEEVEVEEAQEGDEESEVEEESQEESETVEEFEEITWNGETKKVAKSELKELAQKGFDYTAKTQKLAEERRNFELQVRAAQEQAQLQQVTVDVIAEVKGIDAQLKQYEGIDWNALVDSDPVQFLKLRQSYTDLKEARQEKLGKFQQVTQAFQQRQQLHMQSVIQEQTQKLAEKAPELTKSESKAALKSYLQEVGFSDAEIGGLTDHRAAILAFKAMQYDKLQKSKPAITKKSAEVPKVLKPKTNAKPVNQTKTDDMALLRKTGNKDVAQRLIESML